MDMPTAGIESAATPSSRNILCIALSPDDANAIRDGLRETTEKWRFEFVSNVRQGITAVEGSAFDAVLVDLQFPGIDAPGFFKTMMEVSPTTLRLGLIAPPQREAIQQVRAAVHQLLVKPCDAKVLKAVLARAFAAQNFLSDDNIKQLVAGIRSLPVLPQTYTDIMAELKSDDPSLERAGQIVARDMGLSTKILSLVNSAFFGLGRSITHPSEAAMFLGTETLKALVLSIQVFSQFSAVKLTEFSVENLWKHSWTIGVLSKRLCEFEETSRTIADEAFLAGLLHDVGKLVLAANHPDKLEGIIRDARKNKCTLWEQEYNNYGASHAELGGYLLGLWGLPAGVVEAVAFHHRPALARRQDFSPLTAVHLANTIGKFQANGTNLVVQSVDMDYLRALGLDDRTEGWKAFFTEAIDKKG